MGIVLKSGLVRAEELDKMQKPIVYCAPGAAARELAVPLNVPLAEKLAAVRPNRRSMRMERCVGEVLNGLPENSVIRDFDVLFHPDYQVDVLKILIAACKRKSFGIIWPGRYADGRLRYAEEGCSDYKTFDISDYDITCVV